VFLDDVMADPDAPELACVVDYETRSLRWGTSDRVGGGARRMPLRSRVARPVLMGLQCLIFLADPSTPIRGIVSKRFRADEGGEW
jgi:hypothetical protein